MPGENSCTNDKSEMINSFPDHIRKQVVDILKTGTVCKESIPFHDIECYLEVSCMSTQLKQTCEDIMLENRDKIGHINALDIAERYRLKSLKREAFKRIVKHFTDIIETEEFLKIREEHFLDLCQCKEIAEHEDIFQVLRRWLEWQQESRRNCYLRLLEAVQYARNPEKTSSNIGGCTNYHAIFFISKHSKHSVKTVIFNDKGKRISCRNLFHYNDVKESLSATCAQRDETEAPYVFLNFGRHVIRYDPLLNKEQSCQPLLNPRERATIVSFGNFIYVLGGIHNGEAVLEVEELDITPNKHKLPTKRAWSVAAKLPDNVLLSNAACISFDDTVYIVADFENGDEVATGILGFRPNKSVPFKVLSEFPQKYTNCQAILHDTSIFVATGEGDLLSFDIKSKTFSFCTKIPNCCHSFGFFGVGDKINLVEIVEKGDGSFECSKKEYDTQTDSWTVLKSVSGNVGIFGSCDIKIPADTHIIPFDGLQF